MDVWEPWDINNLTPAQLGAEAKRHVRKHLKSIHQEAAVKRAIRNARKQAMLDMESDDAS
jgi:hypothetical protein